MKFIISTATLLTVLTALPSGFNYFADQSGAISSDASAQQAPIFPSANSQQAPTNPDQSNQSEDGKTDRFWGGYYPYGGYYPWGGYGGYGDYGGYGGYGGYGIYGGYGGYGPYWRSKVGDEAGKAEGQENNKPSA